MNGAIHNGVGFPTSINHQGLPPQIHLQGSLIYIIPHPLPRRVLWKLPSMLSFLDWFDVFKGHRSELLLLVFPGVGKPPQPAHWVGLFIIRPCSFYPICHLPQDHRLVIWKTLHLLSTLLDFFSVSEMEKFQMCLCPGWFLFRTVVSWLWYLAPLFSLQRAQFLFHHLLSQWIPLWQIRDHFPLFSSKSSCSKDEPL